VRKKANKIFMLKPIISKIKKILEVRQDSTVIGIVPKSFIKKFLPRNPIVVEAGAHIGSDTVEMAKLLPKGTIHAFEPVPSLYEQLEQNTYKLNNVRRYRLGLADYVGTANLFLSSGTSDASSSLLFPKEHLIEHPEVFFQEQINISVTTLDHWAHELGIQKVDLLWLDLQGYEFAVLKASPILLATVRVIYTEVNLKELYEGCPLYPEFRQWLKTQGFRIERQELAWEDAGNVLFVREGETKT
jgi:FkbM family methyltransferase